MRNIKSFQNYHLISLWVIVLIAVLSLPSLIFSVSHAYATEMDSALASIPFLSSITIDDVVVFEGETAIFTLEIGTPSSRPITVEYATANETAIAGQDYDSMAGTITFTPDETEATIEVPTIEDAAPEPDEDFFVNLSNAQGPAVISDSQGVGTIIDDDGPTASMIIGDDTEFEGETLEFLVRLSNPVSEPVTVQYFTTDGTASAGDDYADVSENSPLTVTFDPGQMEQIIAIDSFSDEVPEPDETFQVILENVTGPAIILDGEGLGTILDDDEEEEAGGSAALEGCTPICPPVIPLVKAEKSDELIEDVDGNGLVDPGDTLGYRTRFDKVEPSELQGLVYVVPLSEHLTFVEGSLDSSSGEATLKNVAGREVVYVDFSEESEEIEGTKFPMEVTFQARVKPSVPSGITEVSLQGTIYSANSPTVVTDDPDTTILNDPTRVPIGKNSDSSRRKRANELSVEKEVLEVRNDPDQMMTLPQTSGSVDSNKQGFESRLVGPGTLVNFSINIKNNLEEMIDGIELVDSIDRHLELQTDSLLLGGDSVEMEKPGETGIITLDIPALIPGETVSLTYWVKVEEKLNPDLGHLGTNTFVTAANTSTYFSDDPETELLGDRTALLLRSHCNQENYLSKWERWLERLSNTKPTLLPVILTPGRRQGSGTISVSGAGAAGDVKRAGDDLEETTEMAWALFGDVLKASNYSQSELSAGAAGERIFGGTIEFQNWPRYAFFGAGEVNFDSDNKGQIFIGLNPSSLSAGEAGNARNRSGGVYIQKTPDLPFYTRLPGREMERVGSLETEESNFCGKEYLPYIMDIYPSGDAFSSVDKGDIDLISLFKVDE